MHHGDIYYDPLHPPGMCPYKTDDGWLFLWPSMKHGDTITIRHVSQRHVGTPKHYKVYEPFYYKWFNEIPKLIPQKQ